MRDTAFGCDWVGTPTPFQRCMIFIIATANKDFQLTAGKFVPVSNVTTINVCTLSNNEIRCETKVTNRMILNNLKCERNGFNSRVYRNSI